MKIKIFKALDLSGDHVTMMQSSDHLTMRSQAVT